MNILQIWKKILILISIIRIKCTEESMEDGIPNLLLEHICNFSFIEEFPDNPTDELTKCELLMKKLYELDKTKKLSFFAHFNKLEFNPRTFALNKEIVEENNPEFLSTFFKIFFSNPVSLKRTKPTIKFGQIKTNIFNLFGKERERK